MKNGNEQIADHNGVLEGFDRKWTERFVNDLHAQQGKHQFGIGVNQQDRRAQQNGNVDGQQDAPTRGKFTRHGAHARNVKKQG